MARNDQPFIIKKIKKAGHAHHGGAWKIAYADFVTAMMAFFLLLWLISMTTPEQKQGLADYFAPPNISPSTSGAGGVMGGTGSGVSADTTDVLIECAYFDPERIARTGRKLALTSDARQRFERGVDPAFLDDGLAHAPRLVLDVCGGTASGVTRAGSPPAERRTVAYDPTRTETLGGLTVPIDRQRAILQSLGFEVGPEGSRDWQVTIPTWRRDVDGPADLVEEVVRIVGIDDVPSVPLPRAPGVARPTATPAQKL